MVILALNEWLGSPIVYSEKGEFRSRLVKLIPYYFNPIGAIHHYRSMADRAISENLVDDRIRIKKLFYVLRPLLACRWIQNTNAQPPTEFQKLITPDWVNADEKSWIGSLLEKKSIVNETQTISLDRAAVETIQSELELYKSAAEFVAGPSKTNTLGLDQFFRDWVEST